MYECSGLGWFGFQGLLVLITVEALVLQGSRLMRLHVGFGFICQACREELCHAGKGNQGSDAGCGSKV